MTGPGATSGGTPFGASTLFAGTNPFETLQAMGAMFGQGSQAFAQLQSSLMQQMAGRLAGGLADGLSAQPGTLPGLAAQAEGFQGAAAAFQRSLASALDLSQTVGKRLHGEGATDPVVAEMLGKIFDPRGWVSGMSEIDGALSRMAEGPQLADLWTIERKFAAVFTAWAAMRRRSLEHNTVMLDAWTRAVGAFSAALNRHAEEGRNLASWREVAALWVETANEVLLETQRSERFLASQRELLKASTDLRLAQQEVAAFYGDLFGLPTRTELDDLHKTVTELRREVRTLQRERRTERARLMALMPREGAARAEGRAAPDLSEVSHG